MAWKFDSDTPVSYQVANKLRLDILNGVYPAGSQFPSVRVLACEASINPNTMQKALSLLEAEGLLESRGTIGRFVTQDTEILQKTLLNMQREYLKKVVASASALMLTPQDIIDFLEKGDYLDE